MTEETVNELDTVEVTTVGGLLTPEERTFCTHMVSGSVPWSQRAHAMLLVDDGVNFQIAGEITGLRPTQVKFWVDAFRKQGSVIFPESVLAGAATPQEASESIPDPEETVPAESSDKTKKPEKTKRKKGKSSKKKQGKEKKKKGQGKQK